MVFRSDNVEYEDKFLKNGTRLAHYTTAENFLNIVESKCVWMRNVNLMNDYDEVYHGINLLRESLHGGGDNQLGRPLKRLLDILDSKYGSISTEIVGSFDSISTRLTTSTFVTCLSERTRTRTKILDGSRCGRAYAGGKNGVAIIIKPESLLYGRGAVGSYYSPVHYYNKQKIDDLITGVIERFAVLVCRHIRR